MRPPEVVKSWREERNARILLSVQSGRQWGLDIARNTGLAPLHISKTLQWLAKQGLLSRDNGKYGLTEKGQLFLAEREKKDVAAGQNGILRK